MTEAMTFFSIITVTRNNLEGLKRTYDSLCVQSCDDYEWLVIDGASDDGTAQFLTSLQEEHLRWTSEPDEGIYDAMNKGINRANGTYILFLNAGDTLYNSLILEKLKSVIKAQDDLPGFVYGDAMEESTGSAPYYKKARNHEGIRGGMFTHHQAMLYRRALIGDLRYDTGYKIAADYKFTAQFLAGTEKILYCPFAICLFEAGGVSQRQVRRGRQEQYRIRREQTLCGPLRNNVIYALQSLMMGFRRLAPHLYWSLRQGYRPSPPAE